jgi:hypothetical protein
MHVLSETLSLRVEHMQPAPQSSVWLHLTVTTPLVTSRSHEPGFNTGWAVGVHRLNPQT